MNANLAGRVGSTLSGGPDLTIYTAADTAARLRHALQSGEALDLDLSDVEDIDTAGLQLLLQLRRTAQQTGRAIRFSSPSPAVQDIVQLLNLHDFFGWTQPEREDDALQGATP